jgi:hypothetical protein
MATLSTRAAVTSFGWVEISDAALRRLRRELEQKGQGVVDEMGVLAIHAGYADYFFPGTSVLQTRARYLFFACWNLLSLARQHGVNASNVLRRKDEAELWVTSRLVNRVDRLARSGAASRMGGVIGIRVYRESTPRVPAQTIDFVYWTALRRWGFYSSQQAADRGRLFRRWKGSALKRIGEIGDQSGDDVIADEPLALFNVPPVPEGWQSDDISELDFELSHDEARLLQERLMALAPVHEGPCLLAKAVELCGERGPLENTQDDANLRPWDDPLLLEAALVTGQKERLERAQRASNLVHYVRAIYAALVEWVFERSTTPPRANPLRWYRMRLQDLAGRGEMRKAATDLDLQELYFDVPRVPELLRKCLSHVQTGLLRMSAGEDAEKVFMNDITHRVFEAVERRRKGGRARLPLTEQGAGRRVGFSRDTIGVYDLDYRWEVIRDLLSDLHRGLAR